MGNSCQHWTIEHCQQTRLCRNRLPSAWLHETEWKPLELHRPAFSQQLKIFFCCLKALTKSLDLPWTLLRGKHLEWLGCRNPVMAVNLRPNTVDLDLRKLLADTIAGYSFNSFSKRVFDPKLHPMQCPVAHQSQFVQERWNAYHVRRRQS